MHVVLSFDDGRKDNYDIAVPILRKYQLTATFNIATAYVDGSIDDNASPCPNEAMTIENVKEIYNDGFEIACHGDSHKNDMGDIQKGYDKLSAWIGWDKKYKPGFASPNSNLSADEINSSFDEYRKMFSYMRIASYERDTLFNRVIRKMAHISHSCALYNIAYNDNIGGIKNGFIAASVPIMHNVTIEQIKSIIIAAKKKGNDCILMFHSILPRDVQHYDNTWSWDSDKFDRLCSWLKNKQTDGIIEVVRTIDLT